MGTYSFIVDVEAPQELVFDLWVNLDRIQEWMEGRPRVSDVTGPTNRAGTEYTLWFGRLPSRTKVLDAERPRHTRTRIQSRMLSAETDTTFAAMGDSATRLTETLRSHGMIAAVVARIFATGSYKGSFRGELQAFKRMCEREAREHGSQSAGEHR
ncbi:MAG: SRPBCC family protein [Chloroflexota bacterium]